MASKWHESPINGRATPFFHHFPDVLDIHVLNLNLPK